MVEFARPRRLQAAVRSLGLACAFVCVATLGGCARGSVAPTAGAAANGAGVTSGGGAASGGAGATGVAGAAGGGGPNDAAADAKRGGADVGVGASDAADSGVLAVFAAADAGAGVATEGPLALDVVRRIVRAHQGAITACFNLALLTNPQISGRARFNWLIDADGGVTLAQLESTTLHDARSESCVLRTIRSFRFPAAEGPTKVLRFSMTFVRED